MDKYSHHPSPVSEETLTSSRKQQPVAFQKALVTKPAGFPAYI